MSGPTVTNQNYTHTEIKVRVNLGKRRRQNFFHLFTFLEVQEAHIVHF